MNQLDMAGVAPAGDEPCVPARVADRLQIFPAAVPVEACERIVASGDASALEPGSLHNNLTNERFYDEHVRMTSVGWLRERDWIFEIAKGFADRANEAWGFELNDVDPMQYAVYRRNDFFEWHKDMLRVRSGPIRKVSVVLQLSAPEQYRGGRLQFLDSDFAPFTPEAFVPQGSVAVFASLLKHRVTPIKDGERRSLTVWFKGPAFR
jgi:PKHD-type hydroxylase